MNGWLRVFEGLGRAKDPHSVAVADLREAARRRLPRAVFDFIDGGADDEVALRQNRAAFDDVRFRQRVLVGTTTRDQSVELFGRRWSAPFAIGPTGLAGLARPGAEIALARAAAAAGVPFTLSSFACATIEAVAACCAGPKWFQLYIFRDRGLSRELLGRAFAAGYEALVVTADCPVGGKRERDPRNHFSIPMRVTPRNAADVLRRPAWLLDALRAGPPLPVNLLGSVDRHADTRSLEQLAGELLDSSVTWDDVAEVRRAWPKTLIVKGVLAAEDVRRAAAIGADGVVVSNHGGRQLDTALTPLTVLPELAEIANGHLALLCDSGFRRGGDVVKAFALGANGVLLGRATLYGVAAAGESGASRALAIVGDEVDRTLALLGCRSIHDVSSDHVALPSSWKARNQSGGTD